jgi:hypothetical protein
MSKNDRENIEKIKSKFADIVSKDTPPRKKLTNKIIASLLTLNGKELNERKLNHQLKKEDEDFLNVSCLLKLKQGLEKYDTPYQKVARYIEYLCIHQMIREGVSLAILTNKIGKYDEKQLFINAQSILISVAFESGASYKMLQANLAQTLQLLLASPCAIDEFNITVSRADMKSTINIVETWAYREEGNFSDKLSVNVFESNYNVINSISGKVNGKVIGYIKHHEHHYAMSEEFKAWMRDEMETLTPNAATWSLWKSPEMRILTKMHDEHEQPELFNALFDVVKTLYEVDTRNEDGHPFDNVSSAITSTVENKQERDDLLNRLEYLRIQLA